MVCPWSPALGLPGSPQGTQGPCEPASRSSFQDMELAYRELLKSLGGESSGGTTPVGSFHAEAARWADCSLSPPGKEPPCSDSWDSHQRGLCPEDSECSSFLFVPAPGEGASASEDTATQCEEQRRWEGGLIALSTGNSPSS